MKVYGVSMVRNEADIVRVNVLYHLALGFDRFLIVDNGSSDGTTEILKDLGRDPRVRWTRDEGVYRQAEITTGLAREALRDGADWVVPTDADEFWHAPRGKLRGVLEGSRAGALKARVVTFIQRREQEHCTPDGLLNMTRRARETVVHEEGKRLIQQSTIAFVENEPSPKWLSRPTEEVEIAKGNHHVYGIAGSRALADGVLCLHAPLRSKARLERKAEVGERSLVAEGGRPLSWHAIRWSRLKNRDRLDGEWEANSYFGTCLDVYGQRRETVFDPRLRNAVAPFVRPSLLKRILRTR